MTQRTKAFHTMTLLYYVLAFILAAFIEFMSTRLAPTDPLQQLLHDIAIAIVLAIVGVFITSATRRLFDSHATDINKTMEITSLWEKFGIAKMAAEWQDFKMSTGAGLEFRNLLKQFNQNATWHIITINPVGFTGEFFNSVILPALENGVKLKWAYVRLPSKDNDNEKNLRDWFASQYVAWTFDFEKNLSFAEINLSNNLNEIKVLVQQKIERGEIPPDNFEIYESRIPTTFLALLAVNNRDALDAGLSWNRWLRKDKQGIVLVDPYIMFPIPHQHHWGMLLAGPGELYEQYATSIIRFFDVGQSEGYLYRVWPET
jgi:uncharacterized membrane protein (DUF485 family)